MTKPKVAFYWCAACGGCEEAVVDLNEDLLAAVALVDVVFWPVALDFKREDVEALADGELAAAFINGAVRTSEQEEMVALLRRKSQAVVAFGSCAVLGGVPGLANLYDRESILTDCLSECASLEGTGVRAPGPESQVEEGQSPPARVRVLTCAPSTRSSTSTFTFPAAPRRPPLIWAALSALVEGKLPEPRAPCWPPMSPCARSARLSRHKAGKAGDEPVPPPPRVHRRPRPVPAGPGPGLPRRRRRGPAARRSARSPTCPARAAWARPPG